LLHNRMRRSSVRLVTGTEIADIELGYLSDTRGGRHGPFDLVIVADGAHSALRSRRMPEARAPLYPWGCLWATVPEVAGIGAAGLLQQRVRGTREMMGLLPIGGGRLTLYWSVPADAPNDVGSFRQGALALWPEAAKAIEHAAETGNLTHATYRHVALPKWSDGNVLFLGDAAHGTSPQLGQGANLGLVDAWTLADSIATGDGLDSALALFARRRTATVRYYRHASHLLTPFFQSQYAPLGWFRDAFMGWSCRLPVLRPMMTRTLAGLQRGWFASGRLDGDGRYRL
jgi:2-polyprenyl-6-methoxyphenol hydroxylase-like FAD-dependent oxidoreductase